MIGNKSFEAIPNECFDGIQGVTEWYDVSPTSDSSVLDRCIRSGSKQIGTIVHYTFWERFLKKLSDHNYEICSETKFIHLTRLDKIRQSISELIATQNLLDKNIAMKNLIDSRRQLWKR